MLSADPSSEPDTEAVEALLARRLPAFVHLDPEGLLEVCDREQISMCGVRPTAAVLVAARELGAASVERVRYATSGDVSGDLSSVVGYAGLIVR